MGIAGTSAKKVASHWYSLPMTAKLLPLPKNLIHLVETTAFVRLGTSFIRVFEEKPSKQPKHADMTPAQKWKQFFERIWVEIFGTASYILVLNLATDIIAKFAEMRLVKVRNEADQKLKKTLDRMVHEGVPERLPDGTLTAPKFLSQETADEVYAHFIDFFQTRKPNSEELNNRGWGLIGRLLFPNQIHGVKNKDVVKPINASIRELKDHLVKEHNLDQIFWIPTQETVTGSQRGLKVAQHINEYGIEGAVKKFSTHLTVATSLTLAAGAVVAALYGGFVIQAINDRIIAPLLGQIFQDTPLTQRIKNKRHSQSEQPVLPPRNNMANNQFATVKLGGQA